MNALICSLDIDECSQSIGNLCAFQCVNVPGSYKCACPPHGYTMSPNGRTCEGKTTVLFLFRFGRYSLTFSNFIKLSPSTSIF